MINSIWIGFDPREANAFAVARASIRRHLCTPIPIFGVVLDGLKDAGLFRRQQEKRDGVLWDVISDAPCATEFSISRFLVPHLARSGWALFIDCDFLAIGNIDAIFREVDQSKAVMCVQHDHNPVETVKMDGQIQTRYARKNWSSCMLFNCDHEANKALTVEMVNELPGRDLHRFCWLEDDQIGALDPKWNYLVGHTKIDHDPVLVHFTDGIPTMPGYENCEYADEWRDELCRWAHRG